MISMLGAIFSIVVILSFIFAVMTGNLSNISSAILDSAAKAVTTTLTLVGAMSLWSGVMEVLREAGAIRRLSWLLSPLTKLLFPKAARQGKTESAVCCLAANLLGIGNAATPLAIDALRDFQAAEPDNSIASDDSVTLTVLSTAAFSLVPTTMLALRQAAGASLLFELLPAVWMNGIIGSISSVILTKVLCNIDKRRREPR